MSLSAVATAYGPAASGRLRDAVVDAKGGDPLAPVTVVVPTNSVGVSARRRLASSGRGVVGVTFLTVYRLAELLGAPRLAGAGRRPVSTPVVAAAVRRALTQAPGMFASVATHPATEEALVAAHRELADLDDAQLDVLAAQHARARDVVRLHRMTRDLIAPAWYDEHDLMEAARAAAEQHSPLLRDIGTVVCFLPQRWSAPAARLLRTLAEHVDVRVIAGLGGSARADATVIASLGRLGIELDDAAVRAIVPSTGTHVVNASDADDEVRAIVRGVVDAMRDGVALERMAVLYGADEPYARLVHEQLDAAGIPHNGGVVRTLADSVAGRAVLGVLALADGDLRRDEVCAFLAASPKLPAVEWERVSRKAGVVNGLDEWRARLDAYSRELADGEWAERERTRARELRAFVDELAAELATRPRTWNGYAQWAQRLLRRFVGNDAQRAAWPRIEQDAAARVDAALDRLGGLDSVGGAPELDVFRRTLELELRAGRERIGQLGEGLLAAPVTMALGVELDRVWICGLAEGVFPSVPNDDPLLSESDRAALHGALRLRADRIDDGERALLAALASTTGARVCTWPRGDLRRSTEHVPSRFLLPTLAGGVTQQQVASYVQGLLSAPFPATAQELAVRAGIARAPWVESEPAVARARDLLGARASTAFTRFDGNLGSLAERLRAVSPLDSGRPTSATRLEQWSDCPHAYFMRSILYVEPVERPEQIIQISAIDRGSLVHDVLDQFLAAGARTRGRLRALAQDACTAAEERGITGRRLLWERDRRMLLAELDAFYDANEEWLAERQATTIATELPFDGVTLAWPDGRSLRLRGKADRIDRTAAGGLVVVDYKTGKPDAYAALCEDDPVLRGDHLQLPVYALAAREAFDGDPVEAYYWFVGRGENRRVGYVVTCAVEDTFRGAVRAIVDGIEQGMFVAVPPPPGPTPFVECPYCDPDGLGTADRWREWERKRGAPELAGYRALRGLT